MPSLRLAKLNVICAVKGTAMLVAGLSLRVSPASPSLVLFKSYVGAYDLSSDGCGSTTQACMLSQRSSCGRVRRGSLSLHFDLCSNRGARGQHFSWWHVCRK